MTEKRTLRRQQQRGSRIATPRAPMPPTEKDGAPLAAGDRWRDEAVGCAISADRWYRPAELSHVTPWSARTFEAWRAVGIGPAYSKVAGRVLYRGSDLIAFLEEGWRPGSAERRTRQRRHKAERGDAY